MNTDLQTFTQQYMRAMKSAQRKVLVYQLDSNEAYLHVFRPEEIEIPTIKEYPLADLVKKYSKLHNKKTSRCIDLEKKKKDRVEIHRFMGKNTGKFIPGSTVVPDEPKLRGSIL